MTEHTYRIAVNVAVIEVRSPNELSEAQLLKVGEAVGHGAKAWLGPDLTVKRIAEPVVEIDPAYCVDPDHRRNVVDGRTYACSFTADAPIHLTAEACAAIRAETGDPCEDPSEHHPYVSPGWQAPA